MAITKIADVIVPEVFAAYIQQDTEEKSRLVTSGALVRSPKLDQLLAGGGLTFNQPSFKDLDNDSDNVATDDESVIATPAKIGTSRELQVRLSRNKSWSVMNLTADLAGADPMAAIQNKVAGFWRRRAQAAFVATVSGVFADNAAAPSASEHVLNDMTHDISGSSFVDGVTNFSASAFIDACTTMGDSEEDLGLVFMHSIVYATALKNNLIDFVADSRNPDAQKIPTFLGRQVIKDDGTPRTDGVFQTWLFGTGALELGMGVPMTSPPVEVDREPGAGTGSGQDTLYSRTEWVFHPVGYRYAGTPASGGPSNDATSNNLAHAGSWLRVFPERKQIKIARLITREFAAA